MLCSPLPPAPCPSFPQLVRVNGVLLTHFIPLEEALDNTIAAAQACAGAHSEVGVARHVPASTPPESPPLPPPGAPCSPVTRDGVFVSQGLYTCVYVCVCVWRVCVIKCAHVTLMFAAMCYYLHVCVCVCRLLIIPGPDEVVVDVGLRLREAAVEGTVAHEEVTLGLVVPPPPQAPQPFLPPHPLPALRTDTHTGTARQPVHPHTLHIVAVCESAGRIGPSVCVSEAWAAYVSGGGAVAPVVTLTVERGGVQVTADVIVEDLHAIPPSE